MRWLIRFFGLLLSRRGRWALVGLALVLVPALVLSLSVGVREWFWSSLGFGYIPVALWAASFLLTLRYRREWIIAYSNVWLGTALIVVAVLGALSLFFPAQGVLEETGLSGNWGRLLGGEPVALGILKIVAVLWLVPFAVAPRWTADRHRRGAVAAKQYATDAFQFLALVLESLSRRIPRRSRSLTIEDEPVVSTPRKLMADIPKARALRLRTGDDPQKETAEVANEAAFDEELPPRVVKVSKWRLPSLDMLSQGEAQAVPQETLDEMATRIETTLSDHGVEVSVKDIKTGPRVIRFGLVPGRVKRNRDARGGRWSVGNSPIDLGRVKVDSILARERDLALALKTSDLRIESPVPGESFVGLEVPSPHPNRVYLRSVESNASFRQIAKKGGLPLALGQGTGGEPVAEDLIELPHLLIAGATGSGKSVCINSMITSLLMSNRPDRLRMLMVDPKRVELTPFNGIPHLLAPVIVDTDEVLRVLGGLIREMFSRYRMMEKTGVRNIDEYNRKAKQPMPYVVLVIDELADLMMAAGYEVEQSLVRLAQLGRATGIHLILCTQRPSVNVVTGLLKANIPARIAFAVASQVDSRVILDGAGADKLLGKGDMLFLSAQSPRPRRIQGTYVSDPEIEEVIRFWKSQEGPSLPKISLEVPEEDGSEEGDEDDGMLARAREMAERYHHMSPSLLQRRLQIGYPRAMRLIDLLEEEGVVAGGEPGRSRQVLKKGAESFLD